MKWFKSSVWFTGIVMVLAAVYGGFTTHSVTATLSLVWIVAILAVLETSLSFDNAIVNAKVLETMDAKWRHRFLTWGMIVAVFGVRLVLPILIVSILGGVAPWDTCVMAVADPAKYASILTSSHIMIAGFGGAFLFLVGLGFFLDTEKDEHWIVPVEKLFNHLGGLRSIEIVITLLVGIAVMFGLVESESRIGFMVAFIGGILLHEVIKGFAEKMEAAEEKHLVDGVMRGGAMSFIFLEVLDTSFSFDGVIGAFVLSNNIFVISAGLAIGAMFVRSLTLKFVADKTLAAFKYLEHGAFWSIITLSLIMFASIKYEIPEWFTGFLSVAFIASAIWSSVRANKPTTNA